MENKNNGWAEWEKYVLKTLETIASSVETLRNDLNACKIHSIEERYKIRGDLSKDITNLAERIKESVDQIIDEVGEKDVEYTADIRELKTRMSIFGAVFGTIFGGITSLIVSYLMFLMR